MNAEGGMQLTLSGCIATTLASEKGLDAHFSASSPRVLVALNVLCPVHP